MHNPALSTSTSTTKRVHAPSVGGGGEKSGSAAARVLGSGAAGVLELALFHPVDTVAKRLMSYEARCWCSVSDVCLCACAVGRWHGVLVWCGCCCVLCWGDEQHSRACVAACLCWAAVRACITLRRVID